MRNKILISSILTALIFIFTLFISNNVYAESDDWTYEERIKPLSTIDNVSPSTVSIVTATS